MTQQVDNLFAACRKSSQRTTESFAQRSGVNIHAAVCLIQFADPVTGGASLEVFKMLKESNALHDKLVENVNYFRDQMTAAGFDIKPTQSAICAVMLYDAKLSQIYAARMQEEGIYVTGFYYPVVPKDQARIRVQISAGHEKAHLDKCIAAFIKVGKELNVLKAE